MLKEFLLAFIPIFVAVDALGTLPIFVSLMQGVTAKERRRVVLQSMITALALAAGFILIGKAVFRFLGITIGDFMIAGGVVLLCIAILDLLAPGRQRRIPPQELGAVPIGTPLIVGPAVLTTALMLVDHYGMGITLAAVLLNILLAGVVLLFSDPLIRYLGQSGARALSKVMALLLAAIAVMMIRKGIQLIILQQ